ncbi:MAG: hypothetical protein NUV67_06400 [archaeon]|nr:hypothetical protein [archaeon]
MKTRLILAIALILLSYISVAGTVNEFTFKSQGYEDFYINDFEAFDCKRYDFVSQDLNAGQFPVFSLRAEFLPASGRNAFLTVYFNDDNALAKLTKQEFTQGVARIWLPREKFFETNNLKVCGNTSLSVNIIKVSSDSSVGVYETAYFPKKGGLVMELDSYEQIVGNEFIARAVAKNYGSENAQVMLTYRKDYLEENTPEVTVLKGETTREGVVPKCTRYDSQGECNSPGELSIEYVLVTNRAVPLTLLPPIMTYTNIFGEEQRVESNRPNILSIEAPQTLAVQLSVEKDGLFAGDEIPITIKLLNIGKTIERSVVVELVTGLEATKGAMEISAIEPGKSAEVNFAAKGLATGQYSVGCMVTYSGRALECENTTVTLSQKGIGGEILIGIGFLLVAAAVFAYFSLKK